MKIDDDMKYMHLGMMIMLKNSIENIDGDENQEYLQSLKERLLEDFKKQYPLEIYDLLEMAVEE